MNAKEIGRKAGRIFNHKLPDNWVFRNQEDQEDYGIDGEIEINNQADKATGFIFKVQIKGQLRTNYIENNSVLSFSLNLEKLRYYMDDVNIPIVLIVVNVCTEGIYWKSLQNDSDLRTSMNDALDRKQQSTTIHLPIANSFPDEKESLLKSVSANMFWLQNNILVRMKISLECLIRKSPDKNLSQMIENNKIVNLYLYNETFQRLYENANYKKLYEESYDVFQSKSEKIETRFIAGLYIERCFWQLFRQNEDEHNEIRLNLYFSLLKMIRQNKGPNTLRLYTIILIRNIKFQPLVEANLQHYISRLNANDDIVKLISNASSAQSTIETAKTMQKLIHLVNKIILSENIFILLEVLPRVANSISTFAYRLSLDIFKEQSESIFKWLDYCIRLSVNIAKDIEEEYLFSNILLVKATYKYSTPDAIRNIDESYSMSESIKDINIRNRTQDAIINLKNKLNTDKEYLNPDEEIAFFKKKAKAFGYNLENLSDECGQIITQGLKDYNPERILKKCKFLFMFPSKSLGVPGRVLGLPTASSKWIYCLKHRYAICGWDLDMTFSLFFKNKYCLECKDKKARNDNWNWTSKWQIEKMKEYEEIFESLSDY